MANNQDIWLNQLRELAQNKVRFSPIKGTQDEINKIPLANGNILFGTDSKMIWLDTYVIDKTSHESTLVRLLMGNGAGGGGTGDVGFIYADADFNKGSLKGKTEVDDNSLQDDEYYIYKQAFSEDLIGLPLEDTLIINSNGWFFRVIAQDGTENRVKAKLISSGAGGGGGGGDSLAEDINIEIVSGSYPKQIINGHDAYVTFIPTAAKDRKGNYIDPTVYVDWKLEYTENGGSTYIQYAVGTLPPINSGEETVFNFGEKAKHSASSRLTFTVSEDNSTKTYQKYISFTSSNLILTLPSSVSNVPTYNANNVSFSCDQEGNMEKLLEFYWDGELINSRELDANSDRTQNININNYVFNITHGVHTFKAVLSQYINKQKGFSVDPIEFEVATLDANETAPIIWLGDYKDSYYNYDNIQIPFRVWVSEGTPEVHLYRENKEIEGSPRVITETQAFSIFEIVDFDLNMQNHYSISCEEKINNQLTGNVVIRDIFFTVLQDPKRADFGIQKSAYLTLSFDASGRSNSESELKRGSWNYKLGDNNTIEGKFENFNWYNNGWITENGKTCLRISNGAKFSIPIGNMTFAGSNTQEQSHSFEFQFKIRNVQDYSNLIRNVTRYKNDDALFAMFYDGNTYQTSFTNYDAFLADYFKNGGTSGDYHEYDDLVFDHVEKQINLNAVACGFFSGDNSSAIGVCLGPQDAFFSNGVDTVNVNYVEDVIINLSAVYSHNSGLMYIYINGVLTGVIKNSVNGEFAVTSSDSTVKAIEFNSSFCDIDLYKIRVYRTDLNVNDIVTNFAVDLKDVLIYDQNKLAIENTGVQEYQFNYNKMIEYNADHIDSPIMPYIIFDTSKNDNDKLSYAKSVKIKIGVEFVNTPLELAYQTGELEALSGPEGDKLWTDNATSEEKAAAVKEYYQHHCPSWKGENIQMAVQGTSSEFYPRRNYKLKTKDDDDNVNIFLNRGPFEADYATNRESTRQSYWYMDNYTVGTTKFTMKIDYMESSGTYNMGFANMVKNAYSKHPFNDLNKNNVFEVEDYEHSQFAIAETFDPTATYYYINHKGNLKVAADEFGEINETNFAGGPDGFITDESKKLEGNPKATYGNHFITIVSLAYKNVRVPLSNKPLLDAAGLIEYRTSVQGFRTLTFHKKSDGSYTYIGMYNMLLDKGSDEVYGFKPDKTTGSNVLQKYLKHKKISKVAECWEFENNSRTFCSFRDPMNRKDLSFDVYTMNGDIKVPVYNSVGSAPVVVDSFEYRYHTDGDILDYIMDPDKNGDKLESEDTIAYMTKNNVRFDFNKENRNENYEVRANFIFDRYKNWEKAVAWVWSTNTDSVGPGGDYTEVDDLGNRWNPNTFYIQDENLDYILDTGLEYDPTLTYYMKDGDTYVAAYLSSHVYEPNKYYIKVNGDYVLSSDDVFDKSLTYYQLTNYTDAQLEAGITKDNVLITYDRLVEPAGDTYDSNATYYSYDGSKTAGKAVVKLTEVTEEEFNENPNNYYIGKTVTYGTRSYNFDTKEYRADKFVNELEKHFDIEYLSTYFVMTEVFECYDSRGKNAMFASWGPQEAGGEYIWYPIFYDIDTQLGINNTGIPSFEYNVDATENGNYSTSDSVLWNSFYKYFKSSRILMKYKHLRGVTAGVSWEPLSNPPLRSVANIEGWYCTDPAKTGSIAMRGKRPLIATNLDEYYKYITITNPKGVSDGTTGHISSNTEGTWVYDSNGTYFYALQGDRSLSRQQFLTNRLEYIDSWLNQGNYARGGSNRMWGRVAANNAEKTSDIWIEDPNDPNTSYYKEENGTLVKRHPLDAEYWLNLTPTHSTYVTLGDDNEAYPSQKYDGINPVRFEISSIENGVRKSENYPEQLLYVYGMNQMADVGDMSNLYWQEFKIEGEAKHLTRLLLGSDELVQDYNKMGQMDTLKWENKRVNPPSIPSSKESSGMPLLKEVNMCNIQINAQSPVLDLTSCEKLQNFRATGSNFTNIKFADGVALDTLYLPRSITTLELTEARQLTKLLTTYTAPTKQGNKLVAEKGLWIDGLFPTQGNSATTSITKLNIVGGNLGYDSYKLLKQYYAARGGENANTICRINLTNVNWSPYQLVEEGEPYNGTASDYKIVNNHYGLTDFSYNEGNWVAQVANKEIYKVRDIDSAIVNQITDISMLEQFVSNNNYQGLTPGTNPYISGIIYVNNSTAVDEYTIRNTLQAAYPDVTFLFNNVIQHPTARFIYYTDVDESTAGTLYKYVKENPLSIQTLNSNTGDSWFVNPIIAYGQLDKMLTNYDFFGWAKETTNDATGDNVYTIGSKKYEVLVSNEGGSWTRPEGTLANDYTFYAIFKLHAYERKFYNADGNYNANGSYNVGSATLITTNYQTYTLARGVEPAKINNKEVIPTLELADTEENFYYVNQFKGWAFTKQPKVVQNLSELPVNNDYEFVAVYEKVSVYNNILDLQYLEYEVNGTGYSIGLKAGYELAGKITLPTQIDGLPVVALGSNSFNFQGNKHKITHIFWAEENRSVKTVYARCFQNSTTLVYIEPISTLTELSTSCFQNCSNLKVENMSQLLENARTLGQTVFSGVGRGEVYVPGHEFDSIGIRALSGWDMATKLVLGSSDAPCEWFNMLGTKLSSNSLVFDGFAGLTSLESIQIFIPNTHNTAENRRALLTDLGFSGYFDTMEANILTNVTNPQGFAWIVMDVI